MTTNLKTEGSSGTTQQCWFKRRNHSRNDNEHPSSGKERTQRDRRLFFYLYREINTGSLRTRTQWWKQYGIQNLYPSLHRHRRNREFPFWWKITCSRNSLDIIMGDAKEKKEALYYILLYIFNCFTDSMPKIFTVSKRRMRKRNISLGRTT